MPTDQFILTLHMHSLASYCWKVLIGLYESVAPFRAIEIDGMPKGDAAYARLWPIAKAPLLQDGDAAREVTLWDRAAMPPLFYLAAIHPYRPRYPALTAYFERLASRPSVQRVVREAHPWLPCFPFADVLEPRLLGAQAAQL